MDEPEVQVLMATFNAERFLPEQINSLLAQSYRNWRLLVRDNASTDATPDLLRQYAERYPGKIAVIYGETNVGAKGNFSLLLNQADAPYVMFSDADDVWLSEKIEKTMIVMRGIEVEAGLQTPVLVHTDLRVVNAALEELGKSFWAYQNSRPHTGCSLNRLLIQNYVTGCTAMLNRSLVEKARPVPEEAIMHDWWIALVAAAFGRIGIVDDQTLLYRQHGGNDTGAKKRNLAHYAGMAWQTISPSKRNYLLQTVARAQRQARGFLERYGAVLDGKQRDMVSAFVDLANGGVLKRRVTLIRYGILKGSSMSTVGLLLRI